jgi:mono/diheme cytochrome c family protein
MTSLKTALGCLVLEVACAATGSVLQRVPATAKAMVNPFAGNAQALRAGEKLYARECASCHGPHREGGGKAPPLSRPDVAHADPGALFWVLRNGSLGHGMPSFAHLPEAQRWQVITFLREATGPPPKAPQVCVRRVAPD